MGIKGIAIISSVRTGVVTIAQMKDMVERAEEVFKEVFLIYGKTLEQDEFIKRSNEVARRQGFSRRSMEFLYDPVVFSAADTVGIRKHVMSLWIEPYWNCDGTWAVNVATGKITDLGPAPELPLPAYRKSKSKRKTCTCRRRP